MAQTWSTVQFQSTWLKRNFEFKNKEETPQNRNSLYIMKIMTRIQKERYSHMVLKTIQHTIKLRLISAAVHPQTFYSFWKSHLSMLVASIVTGWVECIMPPKQRKPDNMWKIALSLPPLSSTSQQDSNLKWAGWYKVNNRFPKTAEVNWTQLKLRQVFILLYSHITEYQNIYKSTQVYK